MADPEATGDKFFSSIVEPADQATPSDIEELSSSRLTSAELERLNLEVSKATPADPKNRQEVLKATPADHKNRQAYLIPKELPKGHLPITYENKGGNNDPKDEPRPPESLWVISIKKEIQQARQDNEVRSRAKHSIYRIPHNLKDGRGQAYVPRVVSLGPYHHGNKHLRQMNQHKWRCLDSILRRTNKKIGLYLDSVKDVEKEARECYEGTISMSSDEFVQMMVLDGCFVIELLLGYKNGFPQLGYPPNDPVFSMRGLIYTIRRDMIMLQNQIPLFILDRLLSERLDDTSQTGLVAEMAHSFFEPLKPTDGHSVNPDLETIKGKFHFLEMFWESLLPQVHKKMGTHQLIQSVTELRKAGIKFRMRKMAMFWDIQFKDGILQIPPLVINDGTRSLFLNLIAFEQCHVNCGNTITSYVFFMDNLINSPEDVGHLFDHGIIKHWLGSHTEVADLFNLLCKEVVIEDSYLSKVTKEVNIYSSYPWNGWMASLKLKYFSNPWSITSLIAAFFLLVLTFLQTFYGVYGYYKPGS